MYHVLPRDISVLSEYDSLGLVTRDVSVCHKTELLFALFPAQMTNKRVTLDMYKNAVWPPKGRDGAVIISIRTMLTNANFVYDLSSFNVDLNLVTNIVVFYVYLPECARRTHIQHSFFSVVHTAVLCSEDQEPILQLSPCFISARNDKAQFRVIRISRVRRLPSSHMHNGSLRWYVVRSVSFTPS